MIPWGFVRTLNKWSPFIGHILSTINVGRDITPKKFKSKSARIFKSNLEDFLLL